MRTSEQSEPQWSDAEFESGTLPLRRAKDGAGGTWASGEKVGLQFLSLRQNPPSPSFAVDRHCSLSGRFIGTFLSFLVYTHSQPFAKIRSRLMGRFVGLGGHFLLGRICDFWPSNPQIEPTMSWADNLQVLSATPTKRDAGDGKEDSTIDRIGCHPCEQAWPPR
jgi:hypothetical protein